MKIKNIGIGTVCIKVEKNDLPSSKYVPFLHPLALNNNFEMII